VAGDWTGARKHALTVAAIYTVGDHPQDPSSDLGIRAREYLMLSAEHRQLQNVTHAGRLVDAMTVAFNVRRIPRHTRGEWASGIEDGGAFYVSIHFRTLREAAADAAAMNVALKADPRFANQLQAGYAPRHRAARPPVKGLETRLVRAPRFPLQPVKPAKRAN